MLKLLLITCLLFYAEGHPKYRRYRRDDDVAGVTYAPCKDTYTQCPEWKKTGMCEMPQYKDYMPLVCTDTCGFCKGIQKARSAITAPMIIDAIETGEVKGGDSLASERSKIHAKSATLKAEAKEDNASGNDEEGDGSTEEIEEAKPVVEKVKAKKNIAEKKSVTKTIAAKKTKDVSNKKSKVKKVKEVTSKKSETVKNKKSKTAKKTKAVLTARKEVPKKKEVATAVKRTKTEHTAISLADLSGAGSGETDTDNILSGDAPHRSNIHASGDAATADAADDDDEESEDDDDNDDRNAKRQNFQLNGDPEMVDLKPKTQKPQPDLNDFPDKVEKANYSEEEDEDDDTPSDDTKASPSDTSTSKDSGDGELDDLKIEELLKDDTDDKKEEKPEDRKKKPTKAKKEKVKKEKAHEAIKEGKISLVLSQNFNTLYEKQESPSYQMLAGNVKKDLEKMVKGTSVKDIAFSEVSVEGNPRQSGKTKVSFNMQAEGNEWMKKLLKLVDGGDIDGLKVIKGSLEIEEE